MVNSRRLCQATKYWCVKGCFDISIICITGILAYSVDTDEMLQKLAYHQDLHCLIE